MNVTKKQLGDELRIYIDDTLHLLITDRITSIHSWKHENQWWKIEIQTKHNTTLLEYDSKPKWLSILKALDNG